MCLEQSKSVEGGLEMRLGSSIRTLKEFWCLPLRWEAVGEFCARNDRI